MGEATTEKLDAARVPVGREQLAEGALRCLDQRLGSVTSAADRPADDQADRLAQPQVLCARQSDWQHWDVVIDGEMGEAFLEWHQLSLGFAVITFGIYRYDAASLQAAVDMLEKNQVR